MNPVDVALSCGYTIISHNGLTVMEIAGNGEWRTLERACRRFVRHSHIYDHYTIVVRHADGTRDLRDVGLNQVRFAVLPPVGFKEPRKYAGLGVPGVRQHGHRFECRMTVHGVRLYLGTYDTIEEAGHVRDKYVIDHNLAVTLNYSEEAMAETVVLA